MQVRIVSDGTPMSARVFLSNGDILERAYDAKIHIPVNATPTAVVSMYLPAIDVVAEADFLVTTPPDGKKYKPIPLE